jgi:uroporphyrinogen decarboxylase
MIDAGIDVFDVAQTSARDMGLDDLYKLYGGKVCIHGAIDSQRLLVQGSQDEIKEEVKKAVNLWNEKGGLIVASSHLITPDTPIKNVLAFYEAIKDYNVHI